MKIPQLFDPTVLLQPTLTRSQAARLHDLLGSDTWETVNELWDWYGQYLNLALINAKDNHDYLRGQILGFALARKLITDFAAVVDEESPGGEDDFRKKWLESAQHDSTTGY